MRLIESPPSRARVLPLIGVVFFLSGFSALVYQVAWQRLLTVYYGVGPISVAIIVSVFMLGLGLGGLFGGRAAERVPNLALAYGLVELTLGVFGVASLPMLDLLGRATASSSYVVAALACALFLLAPTLLMGATLPIVLKLYRRHATDYLESLSALYFVNTLGAAVGSLLAAFVLISFFGIDGAVYTAAGVNLALAFTVFVATRGLMPVAVGRMAIGAGTAMSSTWAGGLVFVTGFVAIGYEILWILNIQQITKASPYSFAAMLFVYLTGIALGSLGMNRLAGRLPPNGRKPLFFGIQVAIAVYVAVTVAGYQFALAHTFFGRLATLTDSFEVHPPPLNVAAGLGHLWSTWGSLTGLYQLTDTIFWPALFMLVPTLLMGASFPLVAFLANGSDHPREAAATGTLYFWNVMGNVLGALATGFLLIPGMGSEATFLLFCLIGALFGLGVTRFLGRRIRLWLRGVAVAIIGLLMVATFPKHGAFLYDVVTPNSFFDEGVSGIVYSRLSERAFGLSINGLGHGGRDSATPLEGRAAFYLEAYGALRVAPALDRVLIIGFGTGSTAEAVLTMPGVRRVTIVEINETLIKNLSRQPFFQAIDRDPRVRWVIDDARRLLNRETTTYDAVLMDPLRETTAYSNNVYSREFFELVKRRLTPGGVLMAWVQTLEQINTLATVFAYAKMECSLYGLGSDQPLTVHRDVEAVIQTAFPPKGIEAIRRRRQLCPYEETPLVRDGTIPVLEDKNPILEYHLGRHYHTARSRRAVQ